MGVHKAQGTGGKTFGKGLAVYYLGKTSGYRLWGSSVFCFTDLGSGSVLPVRSGEPEADGTGDRRTVRCPSIGSCMILMQTLSSGDLLSWIFLPKCSKLSCLMQINDFGQILLKC